VRQQANFGKLFLRPIILLVIVFAFAVGWVVGYGEWLLAVVDPSVDRDSFARPEIWVAVGSAAVIVIGAGLIAYSPPGRFAFLEQRKLVGREPIFTLPPPGPAAVARHGATGSVGQIGGGYTLFLRDQPLAYVVGTVPGRRGQGGFLYAAGFEGNARQIWVPVEAVAEVYPDSQSAFLTARGMNPNAWTVMPESVKPVRGS
jgi:hypothetical protein